VTDTAAVVTVILNTPSAQQQQKQGVQTTAQAEGGAAAGKAPAKQHQQQAVQQQEGCEKEDPNQLSALDILQRQMLQAPTSEQQILRTVQMADKAGLNKEGQQLLLLVMYHQLLDLVKQQDQGVAPVKQQDTPAAALQPQPQQSVAAVVGASAKRPRQQQQQQQEGAERPVKQPCPGLSRPQQTAGLTAARLPVVPAVPGSSYVVQGADSITLPAQPALDLSMAR
jgi:hypothetical protein